MSFINDIRTAAQNAARDGLSKLGIHVSHKTRIPDDEDTYSPDIIDLLLKNNNRETAVPAVCPVPQEMHDELLAQARDFSGNDAFCLETVQSWLNDRASVLKDAVSPGPLSPDDAHRELFAILNDLGFTRTLGSSPNEWLDAACEIIKRQERVGMNLLIQAAKQTEATDIHTWMNDMNEKISRFGIRLCLLNDRQIGIKHADLQ